MFRKFKTERQKRTDKLVGLLIHEANSAKGTHKNINKLEAQLDKRLPELQKRVETLKKEVERL